MKLYSLLLLSFIVSGCASSTKQSDALLTARRHDFKGSARVEKIPFVNQKTAQCGPATLTMAMNWAGKPVTVTEIVPQVYTPGMKGSLQTDMTTAARRQGLLAIPITGMTALLTEIDRDHPVIVFENLALKWVPQWHYAIVFGYDLEKETVLMHSGPEKNKIWDMRKFERSWKLGDYWGLLVLPPSELSATASELEHATAAAGLEQVGKREEAAIAYRAILTKWPDSLSALVGMGGWEYEQNQFAKSVQYLRVATRGHPSSAAAWHNLAIAENAARMRASAKKSAERALDLVSTMTRSQYEISLRLILDL